MCVAHFKFDSTWWSWTSIKKMNKNIYIYLLKWKNLESLLSLLAERRNSIDRRQCVVRGSGGCWRQKTRGDDTPQNTNDENIIAKKIASLVSPCAAASERRESTTVAAASLANQSGGERGETRLGFVLDLWSQSQPFCHWLCRPLVRRDIIYAEWFRKKVECLGLSDGTSLAADLIWSSQVECKRLCDVPLKHISCLWLGANAKMMKYWLKKKKWHWNRFFVLYLYRMSYLTAKHQQGSVCTETLGDDNGFEALRLQRVRQGPNN